MYVFAFSLTTYHSLSTNIPHCVCWPILFSLSPLSLSLSLCVCVCDADTATISGTIRGVLTARAVKKVKPATSIELAIQVKKIT